ncbi:DoxX family protein [Ectothiorhodospiraceae bacterium 2226]|nr:DoxX family protein [Ectothiorhodospiraceae bacterium 2226]
MRNSALALLLARLMLAAIFIIAGLSKVFFFNATVGYIASKGLPLPQVLLVLTIAIEIVGGLMLALGLRARLAALVLFLFLIPVTYYFHPFWDASPAAMRQELNQFLKNLAIMGGMLYVMAAGPGRLRLGQE